MSITSNLPFRETKRLAGKQKTKEQFTQMSTKITSYKTIASSIQELLQSNCQNSNFSTIQQLRIMHSQHLQSLKGIQVFKSSLVSMNLSSNIISSIQGIQQLTLLQTLQLKNNKIQSLKGIQKCTNLIKLDVSNNKISSFDGLRSIKLNNKLQKLFLAGNLLQDLNDLQWLSNCQKIKQITFTKGSLSNPMCENYGDFIFVISQTLGNLKNFQNIIVDDLTLSQHLKQFQQSNQGYSLSRDQDMPNQVIQEKLYGNSQHKVQKRKPIGMYTTQNIMRQPSSFTQAHSLSPFHRTQFPQNQFLLTQNQLYQQQTQQILQLKKQQIQDLKYKNSQLEVQKSTQFKQLLKKQTEVQRLQGQNKQLHKQLEKKQKSLAEIHKRVQQMLKSSSQRNNVIESKNSQIEKIRQQLNQTKIQSAEYKALVKDYERRLSQLHEKTITTIEERTLKQDEMKRKNEELYDENYRLQKQKEQMKDRMRQLTQLLREWEFKYESKINQIQARHAMQRQDLLKQAQEKISTTVQNYEHQLEKVDQQMRHRVEEIQSTYKSSLQEAYEKHKKLKTAYQQRTKSQQQMKVFLKSAFQKNQEQESLITEFQEIVIKLKGELSTIYEEKQHMAKQNGQLKYRGAQQMSSLEQKLSKALYDKSRVEKELMDLKETHAGMIQDNESQMKYQKLYQQLQAKYEDLQTSFDAKTQLLQDKNDTIESLKQQIQALQRQGADKVDLKQFESIRKKYQKYKKQNHQLTEESANLLQENDDLRKQNEDCKEIALEFDKMKDTLTGYEKAVEQKDMQLQQLMRYIQECKRMTDACKQQVEQWRRQCDRIETQSRNKERQLKDQLRDMEIKNRKQIELMKVENEKYRKNALQELQTVFLKLQK